MTEWRDAYAPGDRIPPEAWVVDPLDRTSYYGATDIAAILGVNPFASAIDVFLEKRDQRQRPSSSWAEMGQRLEAAILATYAAKTGYRLRHVPAKGIGSADAPLVRCHPDSIVLHEPGLVDAKATERTAEYGEPMTAQVPLRVKVQMVVYLGHLRREWADVVVLPGATRDTPIYRVGPDPDLYRACLEAVSEFHDRHVLAGVPPPPDGSASWRAYIGERFPDEGGEMQPATSDQMLLVDELRLAVDEAARANRRLETAKQRLIELLAGRVVLPTRYGAISYRREGARANPWDVAKALAGDEATYASTMAADAATRTGPRVLRHPFRENGT